MLRGILSLALQCITKIMFMVNIYTSCCSEGIENSCYKIEQSILSLAYGEEE